MAQQITPMPTPPSRSDPGNFASQGDTFLGSFPQFVSEANALASEAENNAQTAETKASEASVSESNTATSETNAASSAASAAASALSAASDAASTAALFDQFDDRFLGAKATDPTVDNDGDPLLTGALYFNTTVAEMRVFDGSAWVSPSVLGGTVSTLQVAQSLSIPTSTTAERPSSPSNGYLKAF